MAKITNDYNNQTTHDLALGFALGKFNETERFSVLKVIEQRERDLKNAAPVKRSLVQIKPGTKSFTIKGLLESGKSVKQVYDIMNAKGYRLNGKPVKVYYPEIYRVAKILEL